MTTNFQKEEMTRLGFFKEYKLNIPHYRWLIEINCSFIEHHNNVLSIIEEQLYSGYIHKKQVEFEFLYDQRRKLFNLEIININQVEALSLDSIRSAMSIHCEWYPFVFSVLVNNGVTFNLQFVNGD